MPRRGQTSGGPNDDRRTVLYRGGRRVATIGDLDQPIAFVRSERIPDDHVAFIQKLRPFYKAWAAVTFGEIKQLEDEPSDVTISHIFTIRTVDHVTLEDRDYVVWWNELFAIKGIKPLRSSRLFTAVRCVAYKKLTTQQLASGMVKDAAIPATPEQPAVNTAFWDQLSGTGAIPATTSALTKAGQVGIAFSYQIVGTNTPYSYQAAPLPVGLYLNPSTGLITGEPMTVGVTNMVINATNAQGTSPNRTVVVTIT